MAVFPFAAALVPFAIDFRYFQKLKLLCYLKVRSKTSFLKQIILCQFTDAIETEIDAFLDLKTPKRFFEKLVIKPSMTIQT